MSIPIYLNCSGIKRKYYIRKGVYAYKFNSGVIEIEGVRYFDYSVKEAIKKWRSENKIK